MKFGSKPCRKLLHAAIGLPLLAFVATAGAEPVTAQWSDTFVDSIGVNVHWSRDKYGNSDDELYDTLKTKLVEAGFRHIRDGTVGKAYARGTDLYDNFGIQTTFVTGRRESDSMSPLDPSEIWREVRALREQVPTAAIAAIEGPNEYDLFHDGRETDWVGKLQTYQQQLYAQVKAEPALNNKPVLGPSLTASAAAYNAVGDLSAYLDYSNLHLYQDTRHPGTDGWGASGSFGSITWFKNRANVQGPGKPIQVTEAGYRTHAQGVSERADAIYTPRMFAEFFRRGISRTFKYELLTINDSEKYGLLRSDGTEKPAFTASKNLINLLSDNTWDAENKAWTTPTFTPGTLDYEIATSASTLHDLLLQKSNGDFYLMLWNEVSSFDPATLTDTDNPPLFPTLKLTTAVTDATIYTLRDDGSMRIEAATILDEDGIQKIKLRVPDRLVIVAISTPEPSTIGLFGIGVLALLSRRRAQA